SSDIGSTVFDVKNLKDCTGGTTNGHQYHFVYPESKSEYEMETVDFDSKSVSHKKIIDLPKEEKPLASFSDNNMFYALMTNDKTGALSISTVDANGTLLQKSIPFPIPEEASKHRDKLSEYLGGLKIMKGSEYPDLSNAVKSAKLFTMPDKLVMVINDGDNPAHIVTLSLPGLTLEEKKIDYANLVPKGEKGKVYVSSFLKGDRLFSLILNKKNIRIAVNDVQSGALLNKIEINDDAALDLFADGPLAERRYGKKDDARDITDIKKLIKAFTNGTEGLMVTENKSGQLIVTVGTYDLIPLNTDGSSGGYVGGFQSGSVPVTPTAMNHGATSSATMVWNPTMYYRPGTPGYTTTSARYYNTTYFKILLDPKTYKTARGRVPTPVPDQIKDYIETIDKKAKATNQFAIGKNQYYGYYDRDSKSYVVEQIRLILQ
ncbi:MAG: hypothetical protein JST39_01135, partial [Bacteroidetes bacterium]|nr:hypothetical protein [Bacteroidota bacterium]